MRKNGFTLIELLAVIIILAVVSLITVPLVLNIINDTQEASFKQTLVNIRKSAERYREKQGIEGIDECVYFSFSNDVEQETEKEGKKYMPLRELSMKGKFPSEGELEVCSNSISMDASNGKYSGSLKDDVVNVVEGDLASSDTTTPIIKNLNTISGLDSITVSVVAESPNPNGKIVNYYYKIDNTDYIKSEDSSYIFNNLEPNSEHVIFVKVENKSGITAEKSVRVTVKSFGEITIKAEPTGWSTNKIVTITGVGSDEYLEYQIIKYEGEEVISTSEWKIYNEPLELTEIATSYKQIVIRARISDGINISGIKTLSVTKIDSSEPNLASVAASEATSKSITVTAVCRDDESGISKIEVSSDGGENYTTYYTNNNLWDNVNNTIDLSASIQHTYSNLKAGTYNFRVRCTNYSSLSVESDITVGETIEIPKPTYALSTTDYAAKKTVTIRYPSGYTNEYSLDGGKTWHIYEKPIEFTQEGTVIARVTDGINTITASSLSVTGFLNGDMKDIVEVGSYIKMTPKSTSYTVSSADTGGANRTLNPSELNVWRVIRINADGTVEMISENVSSISIDFKGQIGYQKLVGGLNQIAAQYTDGKYVTATRHMGYNGQIEYITDTSKFTYPPAPWTCSTGDPGCDIVESQGGGDMLYQSDVDLVKNAIGKLTANKAGTSTPTSYFLASRKYEFQSSSTMPITYRARQISNTGSLLAYLMYYFQVNNNDFITSSSVASIRPIVTLRADTKISGGRGTAARPFTLE